MQYIDLHCDTLMRAFSLQQQDIFSMEKTMVDIRRLQEAHCMAQFFAIFMPSPTAVARMGDRYPGDDAYIHALHGILTESIRLNPSRIASAENADDICANHAAGKASALLTLEDGRTVEGSMANLERFYGMGIRLISLTWNQANCFGAPNSDDPAVMNTGLTDFGKDAVVRMQELGMLVDVSHLSDGGFWDVAKLSHKPFVASHSNCRAIAPHRRNLTDEMIRALADRGGVAGLNFCPQFLTADVTCSVERAEDIARNARHMANTGGIGCVALGTDFDGIDGQLEVGTPTDLPILYRELAKVGFSEDDLEKITHKNAMRVIRDTL